MKILSQRQIEQKINRLSIQILENNFQEKELILAGINNNGMVFAQLLCDHLSSITPIKLRLSRIRLNPANPLDSEVEIDIPVNDLKNKAVIIVDDVANTGRTLFYATKPIMQTLPKRVEIAVLVERHHKAFPVQVDYVGLSLATTLKEDIDVQLKTGEEWCVYLN